EAVTTATLFTEPVPVAPPPAAEPAEAALPTEAVTTATLFTETVPVPPPSDPAEAAPPTEAVTTTTLFTETVPVSPPPAPAETGASSVPPEKTINPDDINPLVPAWQLLQEEISPAVAAASATPAAAGEAQTADGPALYTQAEYDKLYQRYQEQKARADALKDSFFACADVMYEMLAYLNASRLYHGKDAVMASDINGIVENNPILNAIANDLRQTSIESGIGIVSELPASQEHLRQHVMTAWKNRMAEPGERGRIHEQLFSHCNIPDGEELF
ncbi:MAG: hypothetical protein ACFN4D_07740, partial [Cardiobacterium sp.]